MPGGAGMVHPNRCMPEGDTILRAARALHRALAGHVVTRFDSVYPAVTRVAEDHPIVGRTIESVSARGKHLLMAFSGDLVLRTHMRMNGSWHLYRPGVPWQRPARDMRVLVATADAVAVGFNVPIAELLSNQQIERHKEIRRARTGPAGRRGRAIRVRRRHRRDRPPHARSRTRRRSQTCCSTSASSPGSATCSSPRSCSWRASTRSRPSSR